MFFRNFICCNHDKTAEQVQTMDMISTKPVTMKSLSLSTSKQPTKDNINSDNKYKFCNTARNQKTDALINDLSLISIQSNHTNNSLFSIVNKLPISPKQNETNSNQYVNDTPTFKVPTSKKGNTSDYNKSVTLKQTKTKQRNSCFSPNFNTNNNNNISNSVKSFGFSYCEEHQ